MTDSPQLPSRVRMRALIGDEALPGAWVTITLPMKRKNDFHLLVGSADDGGEVEVSREEVLRDVQKTTELSLMDYADLSHWDGSMIFRVLDRDGVKRLLSARKIWGEAARIHTPDDIELMQRYDNTLEADGGKPLRIHVTLDPTPDVHVFEEESTA
jgi:hypothetical protein